MLLRHPAPTDILIAQASDLAAQIEKPMRIDDHICQVGVSIGIARFKIADTHDTEQPLVDADVALYKAKSERRAVAFATPEILDQHKRQTMLRCELETAISANQFIPYFQPQIDHRDGTVVGAEGLARWNHPTRGILTPYQWLTEAEHADLLYRIDRAIIGDAIKAFQSWRTAAHSIGKLSLNLTLANLRSDAFMEELQDILFTAGIAPHDIQLELLEAILFDKTDRLLIRKCKAFDAAGFQLALDDFGTGRASIATLIDVPISVLKIDRSFVAGIDDNIRLQQIMRAVLAMCQEMNLKVVAEGVETAAELQVLSAYGCNIIQGYYYAKPMDQNDFGDWLTTFAGRQEKYASEA